MKTMNLYYLFIALLFPLSALFAQTDTTWNQKKCAVVLTYDDGLNIDLSHVIPALDSVNLKATFYISDYFNGLNLATTPSGILAIADYREEILYNLIMI